MSESLSKKISRARIVCRKKVYLLNYFIYKPGIMEIDQYLRQSPIYLFNEIHQILFRDIKTLLKEKGVNFLQALIVITVFLERRKRKDLRKKISPGHIFKSLKVSKGGMSQNLSFLEEKGLLKRVLDQEDARSFSLELTEKGESSALELMQIFELKEKNIEKRMGKVHLDELVEILERFKEDYSLNSLGPSKNN